MKEGAGRLGRADRLTMVKKLIHLMTKALALPILPQQAGTATGFRAASRDGIWRGGGGCCEDGDPGTREGEEGRAPAEWRRRLAGGAGRWQWLARSAGRFACELKDNSRS